MNFPAKRANANLPLIRTVNQRQFKRTVPLNLYRNITGEFQCRGQQNRRHHHFTQQILVIAAG